jgi:tetratricopeptide (TPR) repeat protein
MYHRKPALFAALLATFAVLGIVIAYGGDDPVRAQPETASIPTTAATPAPPVTPAPAAAAAPPAPEIEASPAIGEPVAAFGNTSTELGSEIPSIAPLFSDETPPVGSLAHHAPPDEAAQSPGLGFVEGFATAPEVETLTRLLRQGRISSFFAGLGALLLLLGTAFLLRSRPAQGSVTLRIEFPEIVDGVFEVRLRRPQPRRNAARDAARKSGSSRANSPHTRLGVQRETQFDGIDPGHWVAEIVGTLSAPRSGAQLAQVRQESEFEVFANAIAPVVIGLPPIRTQVELRVHWDRQPARDIAVSLRGHPETLRYSGHGVSRIQLGLGEQTLLIGAGDRVVERVLQLDDYEPKIVPVDIATSEGLVFKGCPPAVTSFLQGDLGGAARSLERDGQYEVASLLLAQLHQEQGQTEHASVAFEKAGLIREAADLRRSIQDHTGAAALYERAGAHREAAEMFVAAALWSEAARVFARLEDWAGAAHAYQEAGDIPGLIGALEAQGEYLRASALAAEEGDRARAIRLLKQVGPKDPDHGRASELLVFAFEQEGHLDLAAHQLERRLGLLGANESAPQLEFHLAELLEDIGDEERALDVLETLRDREPTYPKVATRIEGLRKKLSESIRHDAASAGFGAAPGATALVTRARYEILDEIGSGGMGRVYKARDRRLGREVALKRMPESLRDHPTAVSLFLGEAQAAARMNHPNIVTLYDADQEEGHFFITMELLHGLPLSTVLEEHGAFDAADTARLGLQACAGLAYAHDQGIVHRDIKTANFFITRDKALKIMDFGLAKIVEAVRAEDETVIAGTPLYMAPEQSTGRVVDGRTDLYGLGVTLFELSTGRLPFFEGDVSEQHRLAEPPDPTTLRADYPPALAALILRMLAKAPEDRPASAAEVASELATFLDESMMG